MNKFYYFYPYNVTLPRKYSPEAILFCLALAANLVPVLLLKFYPSADGPSHLYNAALIRNLVTGNGEGISDFYALNPVPVPNWTGHFALAVLGACFSAPVAEKLFILLFMIFLPVSFRYMVRSFTKNNTWLTFLIFPFCTPGLMTVGFYNFCLSFIFLFFSLGYLQRKWDSNGIKVILIVSLLFTLTWFSNLLTFIFLLLLAGGLAAAKSWKDAASFSKFMKDFARQLLKIGTAAMPGILLTIIFFIAIPIQGSSDALSTADLWASLAKVTTLVNFAVEDEAVWTRWFFILYVALMAATFICRLIAKPAEEKKAAKRILAFNDVLLLFSLGVLILYFFVPDGTSAGMMTSRLLLSFFLFFILWLAVQQLPGWLSMPAVLINLTLTAVLAIKHYPMRVELSQRAADIHVAAAHLKSGSLLAQAGWDSNWLMSHAGGYLAAEKPTVILDNYETDVTWFPVVRNARPPRVLLGDQDQVEGIRMLSDPASATSRKAEFVLLYGNTTMLQDSGWIHLKRILEKDYKEVYAAGSGYAKLFELKK